MNKLFKLIIFSLLLSTQLFPQSISRLKAKKEREKKKREKSKVEKVVKDDSQSDTLSIIQLDQKNAKNAEITNVNDLVADSLVVKKDKSPKKIKKKKTIIPEVSLSINTIPENVDVFLDGNLLGKTPLAGEKISAGDHNFEIQKEGYAPISYDLSVNPSKSVSLDFFMNPVYDVRFKTEEIGLIFELNDTHRWTEKLIGMQLEAGDHHLRVYKLGEVIDEQVIIADQPLTFQYYLNKGTIANPKN